MFAITIGFVIAISIFGAATAWLVQHQ